ncbi:MAG: alpha-ketoacid dehydrogenase subunit beta [Armatimonadetes bacterium]|nr:alpha-ketoacid dehydrogenase subunit beta [Armatimonadota bacterium]
MANFVYREALREALREEMIRDEGVFIIGEEVALYNGAQQVTRGLLDEFGEKRVVDTPIAEAGFAGLAVGAAMMGLKPVCEFMTWNFSFVAFDQVINHAAKYRYMSGGQFNVPIVFRGPNGKGIQLGAQHSHAVESIYAHFPGCFVVAPGTPGDAKGMLKTAIRCEDPVIFLEAAALYGLRDDAWRKMDLDPTVGGPDDLVPFGVAETRRPGRHVTLVTYSHGLSLSMKAAQRLAEMEIEAEVIDLRTLRPLDIEAVARSLRKTHHAIIVEEDWKSGGIGAEIGARIMEDCFDDLDAPVARVTMKEVPLPFSRPLEDTTMPNETDVIEAVKRTLWRATGPFHFTDTTQGESANGRGDNAQNGRSHGGGDSHTVAQEGGRGGH